MHDVGVCPGPAERAVAASPLAFLGHLDGAEHAHSHQVQAGPGLIEVGQPRRFGQHVVDDDVQAALGQAGDRAVQAAHELVAVGLDADPGDPVAVVVVLVDLTPEAPRR